EREEDYMAPVTAHFGYNNVTQYDEESVDNPSKLISGCTFEDPDNIVYIDELDENDNVHLRLEETKELRNSSLIKPEMEWLGDGIVHMTMFLPTEERVAEFAAIEIGKRLNLEDVEVIHKEIMQAAEGTRVEIKGRVPFTIDIDDLVIPPKPEIMTDDEIREDIDKYPMKVVA